MNWNVVLGFVLTATCAIPPVAVAEEQSGVVKAGSADPIVGTWKLNLS